MAVHCGSSSESSSPTSRCSQKRKQGLNRCLYTHIQSGICHNSQEVNTTKCPPMGHWITKMWCVHAMDYYSALKRDGVLTHVMVRTHLGDIMLNEINQPQNDKHRLAPLTRGIQNSPVWRRKGDGGCQGPGRGAGELVFSGEGPQLRKMRTFWRRVVVCLQNFVKALNATDSYT